MTKILFEWADMQIIQSGGHFFIRYDAGAHQIVMRQDEITEAEALTAMQSQSAATHFLSKLQKMLIKRGVDPYKSNVASEDPIKK